MKLQDRIDLLVRLGEYILSGNEDPIAIGWLQAKENAGLENGWFVPESVENATRNIANHFLQKDILQEWVAGYSLDSDEAKTVGIVMAGNIPLVGFHDFLCVFISGHNQTVKLSSKDDILFKHLTKKLAEWEPETEKKIQFLEILKGCDAYIATGSNNSARYFE